MALIGEPHQKPLNGGAVDDDGKANWFKSPDIAAFTSFWYTDNERAPLFEYEGDWRESLTERP